jgi:uncharacterized protein (DUF952 family)
MPPGMTDCVYKWLTLEDWRRAEVSGEIITALDTADGYVHLSTRAQAGETARRHFSGMGEAILLEFDAARLDPLKWEKSRGGEDFPHLYGPLKLSGARRTWHVKPDSSGHVQLPEDV